MCRRFMLLMLGIFLFIVSVTQLYAAEYSFTTIDYPGAKRTYVRGINDLGQIVGWYYDSDSDTSHGFIYNGSRFTTIDYPGAEETIVSGINDSGQIVGWYSVSDISHGFLVPAPTSLLLLGTGFVGLLGIELLKKTMLQA